MTDKSKGNNIGNGRKQRRVSAQVRRTQVLTLKAAGHSDRGIVALLADQGINVVHGTVNNDWHKAIDERITLSVEEALEVIKLQMERIEMLISVHFDEAMEGDIKAGAFILKLLHDQRELIGLRKPEVILYQKETEVTIEQIEESDSDDYSDRTDTELARIIELGQYLFGGNERALSEGSQGT